MGAKRHPALPGTNDAPGTPFVRPSTRSMLAIIFWILVAPVVWCYVGYPLLILTLAKLRPRPLSGARAELLPTVTAVVAARNERAHIERRIENLLAQRYPPTGLSVIVASNGSTDG